MKLDIEERGWRVAGQIETSTDLKMSFQLREH